MMLSLFLVHRGLTITSTIIAICFLTTNMYSNNNNNNILVLGSLSTFPVQHNKYSYHPSDTTLLSSAPASIRSRSRTMIEASTDEDIKQLERLWWNWNFCTNADLNSSFTPMNSLVPNNTIFLASYPTFILDNNTETCQSKTVTRIANISVGVHTIFYPLGNNVYQDIDDDYELGLCGLNYTNETKPLRLSEADSDVEHIFMNETHISTLYSYIDNVTVTPIFIYNTNEYYLSACPDDENKTVQEYYTLSGYPEGDTCDIDPYEQINGLDAYPSMGYYGIDTRDWKNGETHIYEFGVGSFCITAKYIITAVGSSSSSTSNTDNNNNNTSDDNDEGSSSSSSSIHPNTYIVITTMIMILTLISLQL